MHIILVLLTLFYCVIILRLRYGVTQLERGTNRIKHSVSIVVAARNESTQIGQCIESLLKLDYPENKLEIIIVDDRSTDNTADIVSSYSESHSNMKLIRIDNPSSELAPKKYALSKGIEQAKHDIIFTTDADCIAKPDWINTMMKRYDDGVGLVAGYSPLDRSQKKSIFHKLVQLDALALASVAAGSIGADSPSTCNGRNLSYRKQVFNQIGGFSKFGKFVSGDDDLFLHHVVKMTDWKVRYVLDPGNTVSSVAPSSFVSFFHQRTRHASKGKHYSTGMTLALIAVYVMNLLFMITPFFAFWYPVFLKYLILSLILKSISEFSLIYRVTSELKDKKLLNYYPLAALFHIPYVVLFGLWGQFGKFKWKGTTFHTELKSDH